MNIKRPIILILLLAAALRVGLLACAWNAPPGVQTPDTRGYIELSDDLGQGAFGLHQPEIFRTPGYPLFLMLSLVGGQEHRWHVALIIQIAADLLLVYLTYLLGWAIFDQRVGLWAAAFQATSAVAIASSMRLLSDGLFAMLLTLALLLFVHYWKFARRWSLAACAATLAAGCYVRPAGQVFAAILAAALLVRIFFHHPFSREPQASAAVDAKHGTGFRIRATLDFAVFLGIVVLLLAPWVIRNAVKADCVGFSSFASDSVYGYAVPELLLNLPPEKRGLTSLRDVCPLFADADGARKYMRALDQSDESAHGPRTPGQAARFRRDYSMKVISEHPWLYARLHAKGAVGFFLPGATDVTEIAGLTRGQKGTSDVLRKEGLVAAAKHYFGGEDNPHFIAAVCVTAAFVAIAMAQYLGVILFVMRRVCRFSPKARFCTPQPCAPPWVLLLALILIASLLSGPYGFPRYQTMIVSLLSIFAAAGWRRNEGRGAKSEGRNA